MEWNQYIHSNPNILLGKPVVKGTRLSVDFIFYPTLTPIAIQAVFAYSAECMQEEALYAVEPLAQ